MHSYTVTIGRNVGTKPMSPRVWASFQSQVEKTLTSFLFRIDDALEIHAGRGQWSDEHGNTISEESVKVTLLKSSPLEERALIGIREHLIFLAKTYQQDAIALTIGESELISAPVPA